MKEKISAHACRQLMRAAKKARDRAYAPYSKFRVGAAVLSAKGKIYAGCNVENASYGLTLCAERTALSKAVSEGETAFLAVAVISDSPDTITPCGACRQFLAEFGDMILLLADRTGRYEVCGLSGLLPRVFGKDHLKK